MEPGGYRTLGMELWKELGATLHGVIEDQEEQKDNGKLTFVGWVNAHFPRYEWYTFNRRVAEILQSAVEGKRKRLMFFMPPRHGKTELISRLFSAYFLYVFPEKTVGLTSYGASLAEDLSRAARANYIAGGGEMRFDSRAVQHWYTTAGGGMWAAGVGGGITGKGFHLGIVDDPVKDAAEAASPAIQNRNEEWWQTTFYSRREPGAIVIVVQTRWHELDLSGWLLRQEVERRRPERWHVTAWEALKEEEEEESAESNDIMTLQIASGVDPDKVKRTANYLWPSTVTMEPDWRKPGEALCPQRYDIEDLLDIKDGMSAYFWAALYQQRPRPKEGLLFKLEHFTVVEDYEVPNMLVEVRFWDYAATANHKADFTSGVRLGFGTDGYVYVRHMIRGQWDSGPRDKVITDTMQRDGPWVYQGREQEPGSAGKDVALMFHEVHLGSQTFTRRATGSKFLRADPLVAAAQHGKLRLVRGPWNQEFIDECLAFGSGAAHDDVVDAAAGAYHEAHVRVQILMADQQRQGSVSLRVLK